MLTRYRSLSAGHKDTIMEANKFVGFACQLSYSLKHGIYGGKCRVSTISNGILTFYHFVSKRMQYHLAAMCFDLKYLQTKTEMRRMGGRRRNEENKSAPIVNLATRAASPKTPIAG